MFLPMTFDGKYSPTRRIEFHVAATHDTSLFVLATGVQVHAPSGWQILSEEHRGEIWRLKSGYLREVCIERPQGETWRAYLRYGTEMKGVSLVRAQLKEAWSLRSFSKLDWQSVGRRSM